MKVLEVSRYKDNFAEHQLPFVSEQGEAIAKCLRELDNGHLTLVNEPSAVEYFLVKGNYVTAVRELKKKIREFRPDVIHAHYGLSAITAELQSLVPVVTTFHNGETHSWWVNILTSLLSLRAKHVIYVAQHIRDMVYFKAKNYSIIPCGVPMEQMVITPKEEARKQLGWDVDKKYILFGGAFSNTRKNYALLRSAVEVLEETKKQIKTACAAINKNKNLKVTKNAESSAYAASSVITNHSAYEQAPRLLNCQSPSANTDESDLHDDSLQKTVIFDNSQKTPKTISSEAYTLKWEKVEGGEQLGDIVCIEMKGLSRAECVLRMCACDLFALPTKNEGSPQALKEAMACNCPIVATDVADIKYLLGDLPGHYVLPNKKGNGAWWKGDEHSVEEMAELLKEALAFEGRTKGRERIVELGYTNELVAKRIIDIYYSIIKKQK